MGKQFSWLATAFRLALLMMALMLMGCVATPATIATPTAPLQTGTTTESSSISAATATQPVATAGADEATTLQSATQPTAQPTKQPTNTPTTIMKKGLWLLHPAANMLLSSFRTGLNFIVKMGL